LLTFFFAAAAALVCDDSDEEATDAVDSVDEVDVAEEDVVVVVGVKVEVVECNGSHMPNNDDDD
jgi:hypothetical protein